MSLISHMNLSNMQNSNDTKLSILIYQIFVTNCKTFVWWNLADSAIETNSLHSVYVFSDVLSIKTKTKKYVLGAQLKSKLSAEH